MHGGSMVDSALGSSVCVGSSLGISKEPRHRGLLTQTWPFALNPVILPGSLSAGRQHLRSTSRFTAPWRKKGGGWWGRWGCCGGGLTVRQLFTVVLSNYFTWKQGHSFLNSSSWLISSYVWNAFLHRDVYCVFCPPFTVLQHTCIQTFRWVSVRCSSLCRFISQWKGQKF